MTRINFSLLSCLLVVVLSPQTIWSDEPALPELKPLERFVGSWKSTVEGADLTGHAETK